MSRNVGRHRMSRRGGAQLLRRPAVLTSAAIATVSMGATAYASTSGAIGAANTDSLTRSALPTAPATANSAADTAAKAALMKRAAAARGSVTSRSMARQATLAAAARANQSAAATSGAAARTAAAAKKVAAAKKAAAAQKAAAAKKASAARQAVAVKKSTQPSRTRPPRSTPAPVVASGNPQAIAASMLSSYGWSSGQMSCLVSLWTKESGWNPSANNPSSGAYGIPQSLPGSKMASAGADWRTNPATQIKWGLGYIKSSYGSPCGAWAHSQATNWY